MTEPTKDRQILTVEQAIEILQQSLKVTKMSTKTKYNPIDWEKFPIPPNLVAFKRFSVSVEKAAQAIGQTGFPILKKMSEEIAAGLPALPSQETENEPTETRSRCRDCRNWSGDSGGKPWQVMCAVNPTVQPTIAELRKARGNKSEARHNCKDFELPIAPVLGGYSERSHSFEFDD